MHEIIESEMRMDVNGTISVVTLPVSEEHVVKGTFYIG
jgi:hypothetical protein